MRWLALSYCSSSARTSICAFGSLCPNVDDAVGTRGTGGTPTHAAVFAGGPSISRIRESDLERALGSSSVIVATNGGTGGNGDITVASGVNLEWSNTNTLGLQSDRDINLLGSFTASDTTGSAVLSLHAINGRLWQDSTNSVINVPRVQVNVEDGSPFMSGNNLVKGLFQFGRGGHPEVLRGGAGMER